jgi:hypothetical protein
MNSIASFRPVLLALAVLAGAFVGLYYVKISPALLFQILGGLTTAAGLLAVARCDYSPRRYYGNQPAREHSRTTQRIPAATVAAQPAFWHGHTVSA